MLMKYVFQLFIFKLKKVSRTRKIHTNDYITNITNMGANELNIRHQKRFLEPFKT